MSERFEDYQQMQYLYIFRVFIDGRHRIKIGITDDIEKRKRAIEYELQNEGYDAMCYISIAEEEYPRDDIRKIESQLHRTLYDYGVDIEKIDGSNFTEYYPADILNNRYVRSILSERFNSYIPKFCR